MPWIDEERPDFFNTDNNLLCAIPARCPYCLRLVGVGNLSSSQREKSNSFDQVLWANKYVVLVPTLGMITPGYFLLVNRQHLINFSYLSDHELLALERSFKFLAPRLGEVFGEYLFFEHGPNGTGCQGGGCVSHAHAHLIPLSRKMRSKLLEQFMWTKLSGLQDIKNYQRDAYMLLGTQDGFYLTVAPSVQSQWVRRQLAATLQGPRHWNWKIDHGTAELESTLRKFSAVNFFKSLANTHM